MPKLLPFLQAIIGLHPKTTLLLGRPIPPGLHRCHALAVVHDRRLSAGIFSQPAKKHSSGSVFRLAVWKSFQTSGGRWQVTTALFPDEIDPALLLLQECRRRMIATPVGSP